ncbi:helix-turn-helix domain-containing protein [Kitasatospora aureofaciens]|uniref:Transcriptional regulator n=1 Tax=Kitasatospora aureofaciens TaxID=1894 RepID=A0A1E7N4L7_KITAU|nr:helix-turn-helix transcriptional regulator [Kitasatospora aureofaciens]QEV02059.1 XRE family transcriptional regulator [Streptomyces viridifaciens]ARF80808.1 transcriptional regulator [Kitasatospora aureofaciens]OEV35612.1 transcriptional regulator [Kitasatospora aureofaciens]UKZ08546.1 helix-turn-helix domain-containing protein [Streptomyces viridifaciens]GGU62168.1 transcriptional regulator [Kitasatospora aureofaciens]
MGTTQAGGGATVRRLLLGSQLRKLRESRGVSREEAGYSIRASESKISRMELGRVGFKERDVADLLTLYGVDAEQERANVLGLVREANATSWWHDYGDVLPAWFQNYLGLEEAAAEILSYEVQFVHGLLQTADYARAVIAAGCHGLQDEEIERRVEVRRKRQDLLTAEHPPELLAVLDEAALRRPWGGPELMRGQLDRLLELAELPNVRLQVRPLGGAALGAESGAFSVLGFSEAELADVVYLEQFTTALYVDKPAEVASYRQAMDGLLAESLEPGPTRDLLRSVRQEL